MTSRPRSVRVEIEGKTSKGAAVTAKLYEAKDGDGQPWLVLAHGAGAGQGSAFMVAFAHALAARHLHVVTFDFPYMEQGRRLPDQTPVLEACWRAVASRVQEMAGAAPVFIGGKSMGGRIASHVAAEPGATPGPAAVRGLVFLGYPLHPPGQASRPRIAHWPAIHVPALFVQGTRDAFGTADEVRSNIPRLGGPAEMLAVEGGDHSFKVAKRSGRSQEDVYSEIQDAIARWMSGHLGDPAARHR